MPIGVWDVEWLNSNSQRKYPLSEEATCRDTSNSFDLPNDFLVDIIWPVQADPSIDATLFHIAGVAIFGAGVTVSIGYNGTVIGSASIDASNFQRDSVFFVQGTGLFFDTVGKFVIGSLETIRKSAGSYSFTVAGGRLEATVIKPDIRGVSALYIKNGAEISEAIQDDIIFQAGERFLLNLIQVDGEPDRLVFNAIDGLNLNEDCVCGENTTLPCIKTVNGIGPNPDGDFSLLEDDCLKLQAIANGLQLHDDCAKPCCGCDELKVVRDAATFIQQQINTLETKATQLESAILQTQLNCLASGA